MVLLIPFFVRGHFVALIRSLWDYSNRHDIISYPPLLAAMLTILTSSLPLLNTSYAGLPSMTFTSSKTRILKTTFPINGSGRKVIITLIPPQPLMEYTRKTLQLSAIKTSRMIFGCQKMMPYTYVLLALAMAVQHLGYRL
jgi:hypothetical protein